MELRQLQTFRVVARTLSFTRAAETLDYAQSSVTAQIQALEDDLGVPLFERLGRRVALTDAGMRLLAYADRLVSLAEEARLAVPGGAEPQGTLVIGAPESLCTYRLPPVVQQFGRRYPKVQLIFQPGRCADTRRALADGQLDLGFLLEEPVQAPHLVVEPLVRERLVVLAPPEHRLAQLDRVGPGDVQGEPLLLTETGCSYREMFERSLARAEASPSATLEFSSIEAIKQCVMAGMGITVLPAVAVASEVAQGRLAVLPWTGPNYNLVMQVAWHKDKWLSPALQAFLDLTRSTLQEDLADGTQPSTCPSAPIAASA